MTVKVNFKCFIGFAFLVGVGLNFVTPTKISAQTNESFSECVANLDNRPGVSVRNAIEQCQDVYSRQWVNESFSECVANLDGRPGVSVNDAVNGCKTVFLNDYVGENFSECVANLDNRPGVSVNDATRHCSDVVDNAAGLYPNNRNTPSTQTIIQGGDPQAISDCMQTLLYEERPVCTRRRCAQLSSPAENANNNFGGWQWQTVRTEISESTAVQACQNAN